jgi:hypothetical protein
MEYKVARWLPPGDSVLNQSIVSDACLGKLATQNSQRTASASGIHEVSIESPYLYGIIAAGTGLCPGTGCPDGRAALG